MIGGYDSLSGRRAAPGEQAQATRTSSSSSSGKRTEETGAGGGKEKRQRSTEGGQQQPPLQTPPRLATGAQEKAREGEGEAKRPPYVKPIFFVGEYVTDEEEMLVDVNAGGTRFTIPRTALAPLMRWVPHFFLSIADEKDPSSLKLEPKSTHTYTIDSTHTVSGVPNPRRLGDVFLDVSPLVFEPLARLLVLPPPTYVRQSWWGVSLWLGVPEY